MEQPLSQRTLLSAGKTEELISLVDSSDAEVVLFYNSLTPAQRANLARLTGCKVFSYLDDFPSPAP
jgi:50S ribosomal subunit-associated GTPase HflX